MGAKVLAVFAYAMLTIITCAGVWNHNPEPFVKWCAGFLFACNAFAIYKLARKVLAEYVKD